MIKINTNKHKNNKFYLGKFNQSNEYHGWFVGDFLDNGNLCKTDKLEILYKEHNPNDKYEPHYHQKKIELIIMLKGKAIFYVNDKKLTLTDGKFLFIDVNNIVSCKFIKKSKIFAIHAPSIPADKKIVN